MSSHRRRYNEGREGYSEDPNQYPPGTTQSAYPTSSQPEYNGSQSGYGTGQTAGYGTGQTAGYGTGQTAGYGTGQTAGYGTGQAAGYGTGQTAGYGTSQTAGYGTGQAAGYGTGQAAGYGTGQAAAYGTGQTAAYDYSSAAAPATGPNYRWWIPAEGIMREVIQPDIQRYLGQDAHVRPGKGTGEFANVDGYWIAAYRNLTSTMIQDLKADSTHWQYIRSRSGGRYEDSAVHQSRQAYGPTSNQEPSASMYATAQQPGYSSDPSRRGESSTYSRTGYTATPSRQPQNSPESENYTHGGANPYSSGASYYGQLDPQQPRAESGRSYAGYPNPASQRGARPGYYIASDGREYPLSSLPTGQGRP